MSKSAEEEREYLQVLRAVMVSFIKGIAPIMAVEIGRRMAPGHVRPSFKEVEDACRNTGGTASTPSSSEDTTAAAAAGG
jgi:chemotaxis protein MotA